MAVVHRRIYSDFLTDGEILDIGSDFSDGATELMTQSHWEFRTSIRIFGTFGRHEDWTSQIFMEIGAAYAAECHFQPDFVPATCSVLL
jgi:hypothetical protein